MVPAVIISTLSEPATKRFSYTEERGRKQIMQMQQKRPSFGGRFLCIMLAAYITTVYRSIACKKLVAIGRQLIGCLHSCAAGHHVEYKHDQSQDEQTVNKRAANVG